MQADAAEFILREKPAVVVVETALDFDHGSATGNSVGVDDASTTYEISMFQQVGRQLSWEADPLASPLWQVGRAPTNFVLHHVLLSLSHSDASEQIIACKPQSARPLWDNPKRGEVRSQH